MGIHEVRRDNLAKKLVPQYPSQAALARAAGVTPQLISMLLGPNKSFGEKAARSIEANLGLAPGWLDRDESGEPPALAAGLDGSTVRLAQRVQNLSPRDRELVELLVNKLAA